MTATQAAPDALAIHGGDAVRSAFLPYGRQSIDADDVQAVLDVLQSQWLTTGPLVGKFESAFADAVGSGHAVAVSNGTAALHAAMHALGIAPGDEVIVPAMTFAATANCVIYQGGTPVFCDVEPGTLLIGPDQVRERITARTRALIAVDFAGQACDYDALREVTGGQGLSLVDDACHAVGGSYRGRKVGTLAELNTFSFHPVKNFTSGEGGMITTDDRGHADRMRRFRSHGVAVDFRERAEQASWLYEVVDLGFNYRLTDIQCALGLSQLGKLDRWVARRREIARAYDEALAQEPAVRPLEVRGDTVHAYHLYVVRLDLSRFRVGRAAVFAALRAEGIGVNVHYIPVHLHPFYRRELGTGPGLCPVAEAAYEELLSLPMFPGMTGEDVEDVVRAMRKVITHYAVTD